MWVLRSDRLGSNTGCVTLGKLTSLCLSISSVQWKNNNTHSASQVVVNLGPSCSGWVGIMSVACSCLWLEQEPGEIRTGSSPQRYPWTEKWEQMQSALLTKEESRMRVPREERSQGRGKRERGRKTLRVALLGTGKQRQSRAMGQRWGTSGTAMEALRAFPHPSSFLAPIRQSTELSSYWPLISSTTPHVNVPQNKGGNSLRVLVWPVITQIKAILTVITTSSFTLSAH